MGSSLHYRFADWTLVPGERSLASAAGPHKLGARAFDVLLALVERRDRTVSKQELLDTVWQGVVVEENNLQVQVATLRKLLGPQSIATIPGRGYRFVLPVDTHRADAPAPPVDAEAPTGATALPPPVPPASRPGQLPARAPALYGREADIAAVRALLSTSAVVTLAGAGGIGKTSVARAVGCALADDFPDGVHWIELAALADAALVVPTVARHLGLPLPGDHDPRDVVLAALRSRRALVVLDNCEHVLDAVAAFVEDLRNAAPDVRVLATSQEPLHCVDEHVQRLGPLALPDASRPAEAPKAGAVALFAARARAVDPRFVLDAATLPTVTDVCRRLDGIPLAIELAAARLPLLGLDGLRARLDERFRLLTAGSRVVLRRHQTLRAAMEWSHGLLDTGEQAVLRRLGVFAGSFTLDFAQKVAADERMDAWVVLDHLGALVDKSLVVAEGDPVPRYRLLESTRAFALERLAEAGETDATLRRHAQALCDWLVPLLERRRASRLDPGEDAILAPEVDNLRAALAWAADDDDDLLAVSLAGASWLVWAYGNAGREGWERLLALRPRVRHDLPPEVAVNFWTALSALGLSGARPETHDAVGREVALLRELDDPHRLYLSLLRLAVLSARRGDALAAERAIDEARALERPAWPARHRAGLQWALRAWHEMQGHHEEALACALRQVDLYAEEGFEESRLLALGAWVAACEINLGRVEAGRARAREALAAARSDVDDWGYAREALVLAATLAGDHDDAVLEGRAALRQLGALDDAMRLLDALALNAALQGRLPEAAVIAGHVDAGLARNGEVRWPAATSRRARLAGLLAHGLPAEDLARHLASGARRLPDDVQALALGDARA